MIATIFSLKRGLVPLLALSLSALLVLSFACGGDDDGGATAAATTPANGGGNGDSVSFDVSMGDNFYDPAEFTVEAGAEVTFTLTNNGIAIHNMRVSGEDGEYNTDDDTVSEPALVTAGQVATLVWTAPDVAGEVIFQCDFHPTDMFGTITVQ